MAAIAGESKGSSVSTIEQREKQKTPNGFESGLHKFHGFSLVACHLEAQRNGVWLTAESRIIVSSRGDER